MTGELSPTVFEWLLADWAGLGDDPAALFPSLDRYESQDLLAELDLAIQDAQSARQKDPPVAEPTY